MLMTQHNTLQGALVNVNIHSVVLAETGGNPTL